MDIKNIPVVKPRTAAPPAQPEGWRPERRFDVGVFPGEVFLVVLRGTGKNSGQTRVSLVQERDGHVGDVSVQSISPLNAYYALTDLVTSWKQEEVAPTPTRFRAQTRSDIRPVMKVADVVHRLSKSESDFMVAVETAGYQKPQPNLSSADKYEFLAKQTSTGVLTHEGREVPRSELGELDAEVLYEILVESK